jgi:hypothetical protein
VKKHTVEAKALRLYAKESFIALADIRKGKKEPGPIGGISRREPWDDGAGSTIPYGVMADHLESSTGYDVECPSTNDSADVIAGGDDRDCDDAPPPSGETGE